MESNFEIRVDGIYQLRDRYYMALRIVAIGIEELCYRHHALEDYPGGPKGSEFGCSMMDIDVFKKLVLPEGEFAPSVALDLYAQTATVQE